MSTDIVTWQPTFEEVEAALTSPGQQISPPADLPLLDAEQISAAIAGRILALDADAALSAQATAGPLDGSDLIGQPIEITGGEFMPSGIKNGPGFYVLLTFRNLQDGNEGMVSTGAITVMSQLARRLVERGPWPTPPVVWCQRDEPTPSGGRPQWLEPIQTPPGE